MDEPVVALSTTGSEEEALRIAYSLTENRLAACVNLVPGVRSVYRWKGKVEEAQEYLLIIKTRKGLMPEVEAAVRSLHSYEVPELITVPVTGGYDAYLNWLEQETR
ncbi:MAG: divalent-cation tolerance protein CutA [Bryobacteraceae bacterium]|nr:divalent-cation tolerance protein CutA [Bryobacteraceae bacterium]